MCQVIHTLKFSHLSSIRLLMTNKSSAATNAHSSTTTTKAAEFDVW